MCNQKQLVGRVAVVTGGGGVLCAEMAKCLALKGASVAILDLRVDAAKAVADIINSEGGHAIGLSCDVLSKENLLEAKGVINEEFGKVDLLVNGAGGNSKGATTGPTTSFFDLDEAAIKFVMDLNFLGTMLPSQVFAADLAELGRGDIINIASMNALRPLTKIATYSAAKAAVANFTQWLSVHMCQNYSKEIRVNAIAPGFFLTEQNRFLLQNEEGELTARGQQIIDHTPMGRFGDATELLGALTWLVSNDAKFVTGSMIAIDGGFSAFSGV